MENKINSENEDAVRKLLDEIFDNFDFERVKKTMDVLDWKWADLKRVDMKKELARNSKGEIIPTLMADVPTLNEIKEEAARLMWDCANKDIDVIATGGFRVEKDFTNVNSPWMRLSFEVTDYDAEIEEEEDESWED